MSGRSLPIRRGTSCDRENIFIAIKSRSAGTLTSNPCTLANRAFARSVHRIPVHAQEVDAQGRIRGAEESHVVLDRDVREPRLRHNPFHGVKLFRDDHEVHVQRVPCITVPVHGKSANQNAVNPCSRQLPRGDRHDGSQIRHKLIMSWQRRHDAGAHRSGQARPDRGAGGAGQAERGRAPDAGL